MTLPVSKIRVKFKSPGSIAVFCLDLRSSNYQKLNFCFINKRRSAGYDDKLSCVAKRLRRGEMIDEGNAQLLPQTGRDFIRIFGREKRASVAVRVNIHPRCNKKGNIVAFQTNNAVLLVSKKGAKISPFL